MGPQQRLVINQRPHGVVSSRLMEDMQKGNTKTNSFVLCARGPQERVEPCTMGRALADEGHDTKLVQRNILPTQNYPCDKIL